MRSLLGLMTLAALGSLGAGCGDSTGSAPPMALLGSYSVMISANGKSDSDEMTVSPASNNGVLLDFVYGISQVRCQVDGSTGLTIQRQVLHVSHSTGVADGYATGMGTIDASGMVNITLDLVTPGLAPVDGGTPSDGGTDVKYTITGMKM
jgi:hypothetical protein